jgi:tRNA U34 5-methylaminomethyl-2-thiouridine-forming methyltransferase MnmC
MKFNFFITNDGSPTLRNLEVDELYHSKFGAYLEAKVKYSDALEITKKNDSVIFDVCFGLGYNTAVAIDELKKENKFAKFYCFENDLDVLKQIPDLKYDTFGFKLMQQAVSLFLLGKNDFELEGFYFKFELGDARNLIKKYFDIADFIFFDPFSPKNTPEMWEEEFLKDVYNSTKKEGKIATYSYSRKAKDSFKNAGFLLKDGPVLGRRSPSLIGFKQNFIK